MARSSSGWSPGLGAGLRSCLTVISSASKWRSDGSNLAARNPGSSVVKRPAFCSSSGYPCSSSGCFWPRSHHVPWYISGRAGPGSNGRIWLGGWITWLSWIVSLGGWIVWLGGLGTWPVGRKVGTACRCLNGVPCGQSGGRHPCCPSKLPGGAVPGRSAHLKWRDALTWLWIVQRLYQHGSPYPGRSQNDRNVLAIFERLQRGSAYICDYLSARNLFGVFDIVDISERASILRRVARYFERLADHGRVELYGKHYLAIHERDICDIWMGHERAAFQ